MITMLIGVIGFQMKKLILSAHHQPFGIKSDVFLAEVQKHLVVFCYCLWDYWVSLVFAPFFIVIYQLHLNLELKQLDAAAFGGTIALLALLWTH